MGQGLHFWDLDSVVLLPPVGSTPSRTGGFLGTTSPGPMAELYGAANQDSGVSSYISAASPAPSTGFGHSLGVSVPCRALCRDRGMESSMAGEGAASPCGDGGEQRWVARSQPALCFLVKECHLPQHLPCHR